MRWHTDVRSRFRSGALLRSFLAPLRPRLVGLLSFLISAILLASDALTEPAKPTLFIVGDSTVRNSTKGQQGWGERLGERFDLSRVDVVNRAIGGRSSRTFITEGRWDEVLKAAKAGDFVLIQFGHNDGIAPDDPKRPRGTLRGVGDETRDIIHPQTKQPEVVHTYGWYLRKYVSEARAKGMMPIVCSPIPRVPREKLAEPLPEPSSYPLWAAEVARAEGVPFIDLHGLISRAYVGLAPGEVKARYFCEADNTHTSAAGAAFNASVVAEAIRKLDGVKLAEFLRPAQGELLCDDFREGLEKNWVVELEKGGRVTAENGRLEIDVPAGCTVWFKPLLTGPVVIEYDATVISAGGQNDRVSDLNCFWMARDARSPDDLFATHRTGKFEDYNPLKCYYASIGGNTNMTTRFRRYIGHPETRPLLPDHDFQGDAAKLLIPNRPQRIRLVADGKVVRFYRGDQLYFEMQDADPYTSGWFGFRTTHNHMVVQNFRVRRP